MRISFNKNKSTINHWPTEALIFMQTHWHVVLWSQVLLPGCQGEASAELWICQHHLQTRSGIGFILVFKLRRTISRILSHFLIPEQGLWSSWWAVCTKPCCLRSSTPFPRCPFFSQVLVLCTMEVVETNLPALILGTAFSSDKAQEEEHLSLAAESSSVFLFSCNFTVITAVMVWLCYNCLAVRQF